MPQVGMTPGGQFSPEEGGGGFAMRRAATPAFALGAHEGLGELGDVERYLKVERVLGGIGEGGVNVKHAAGGEVAAVVVRAAGTVVLAAEGSDNDGDVS